jgi:hypothetical protein
MTPLVSAQELISRTQESTSLKLCGHHPGDRSPISYRGSEARAITMARASGVSRQKKLAHPLAIQGFTLKSHQLIESAADGSRNGSLGDANIRHVIKQPGADICAGTVGAGLRFPDMRRNVQFVGANALARYTGRIR